MSKQITTSDLYESAFYLVSGFEITAIKVVTEAGNLVCQFTHEGENIQSFQLEYFNAKSTVNLLEFRRSYRRVHTLSLSNLREARKKLKTQGGTL